MMLPAAPNSPPSLARDAAAAAAAESNGTTLVVPGTSHRAGSSKSSGARSDVASYDAGSMADTDDTASPVIRTTSNNEPADDEEDFGCTDEDNDGADSSHTGGGGGGGGGAATGDAANRNHSNRQTRPRPRRAPEQPPVFGPNMSALAMLKQLKFSPFVAARLSSTQNATVIGTGGNANGPVRNVAFETGADVFARRQATSPWEFFTPNMLQVYSIVSYVLSLLFFGSAIACMVARYKEKPNKPIVCDARLDTALSWLAGLQLPVSLFLPFWMALFNEYIYPPLHSASRVPLERTFRFFNHFVLYSTFLAFCIVSIFGSSLYALSVAKSWNLAEHEACGSAFSTVRGASIASVSAIGFVCVAHVVHWAWLNSKLDELRSIVRPIPLNN